MALAMVIIGIAVIVLLVAWLVRLSSAAYSAARYEERDERILFAIDAAIQRYAAKLTVDPSYPYRMVDEIEAPRRCTDDGSPAWGQIVQPGQRWISDCGRWDYEAAARWFDHPRLDAEAAELVAAVDPGAQSGAVTIEVTGRSPQTGQRRAVRAELAPRAASEFLWLSELDLRFASGTTVNGPVYSGRDVYFHGPQTGRASRDVFASRHIVESPELFQAGRLWDASGNHGDIEALFPEPLLFDRFWSDIELAAEVACERGGICLTGASAYRVQPYVEDGVAMLALWESNAQGGAIGCVDEREFWWRRHDAVTWISRGRVPVPGNGIVWADGPVVVGNRDVGRGPAGVGEVGAAVTIMAGTSREPADVIVDTDLTYANPDGDDLLGLVATADIVLNPDAIGMQAGRTMSIEASLLAMGDSLRVARNCGSWGEPLAPGSTLEFTGSLAMRAAGDHTVSFTQATYDWDVRLDEVAPPLFPRLVQVADPDDWQEIPIPAWAR